MSNPLFQIVNNEAVIETTTFDRKANNTLFNEALTDIRDDSDSKIDLKKGIARDIAAGQTTPSKEQRMNDIRAIGTAMLTNWDKAEPIARVFNQRAQALANDTMQEVARFVARLSDSQAAAIKEPLERLLTSSKANGVFRTFLFGMSESDYSSPASGILGDIMKKFSNAEKQIEKAMKEIEKKQKEADKVTEAATKMTEGLAKAMGKFFK
jgi:hypothetical protein